MKKIGTAVAVLAAAAIGLSTFAACAKKNDTTHAYYEAFDVTNYAHPLDSAYAKDNLGRLSTLKAPTQMVKKNFTDIIKMGDFAKATLEDGSAVLYDAENDKELFTGLSSLSITSAFAQSNNVYIYILGETKDETTTYKFAGPDGKLIVSGLESPTAQLTCKTTYTENNVEYNVMELTYTANEKTETKTFAYNRTDGKIIWKQITEIPSDGYEIGKLLSPKRPLINTELYPDCTNALKDYEVVTGGTDSLQKFTFYKENQVTGSLTIENGKPIGIFGNYLFYVQDTYVSSEAVDGYNYEMYEMIGYGYPPILRKVNSEFYRYNVAEGGEAEKLDVNYVPMGYGIPLYNYSTNKFDRLLISMGEEVNGVYIEGNSVRNIIINENGEIQSEIKGNISTDYSLNVYKLSDSAFLMGSFSSYNIVDKNLATIAELPNSEVKLWEEQSLLVCNNIAVDFEGKVAINLPGGRAAVFESAYVTEAVPHSEIATVYSKKYPNGKLVTDIITGEEHQVIFGYGMILKAAFTSSDIIQTVAATAYTLDGNKIGDMMVSGTWSGFVIDEPLEWVSAVAIKGVENEKPVVYIFK